MAIRKWIVQIASLEVKLFYKRSSQPLKTAKVFLEEFANFCVENDLGRIAIADGSDDQYDSALFLKSNSFESGVNADIGNIYQNGLQVSFENNSIGSQFFWDFGDGFSCSKYTTYTHKNKGIIGGW